jgi:hypothetical protein
MRSGLEMDSGPASFTLSCPGYRPPRGPEGGPIRPGNLSFMIGHDIVAEIGHADLIESWQAASRLSAAEAVRMSEMAGSRLAEIIESGLSSADLTDAVTDAAVLLLLAMKRYGISDPKRIPPCTVMWNGHDGRERVLLGA